jgi:hypothetical protein
MTNITAGPAASKLVFLPAGTECDQAVVAAVAETGGYVVANDMDVSLAIAMLSDLPFQVRCIRLGAGIRGPCRVVASGPGVNHEAAFKEAEGKAALTLVRVSAERQSVQRQLKQLQEQQPQVLFYIFSFFVFFSLTSWCCIVHYCNRAREKGHCRSVLTRYIVVPHGLLL